MLYSKMLTHKLMIFLIILFSTTALFGQENGVIRGTVVNQETQEPLIGVNVLVLETQYGASTNAEGEFRIPNMEPGTYRLQFQYIGFASITKTDIVVSPAKPTVVNAEMSPQAVEGEEVLVTAGYFNEELEKEASNIGLSREEIRRFPGGFEDVVRTVASLPGVAINTTGGRNDLLVRGGGPSENLYVINNIEVPNINHFGTQGTGSGSLSFINLDFVENVDFSTGGFGVEYGDKMSSVLSLDMREGRQDQLGSKWLVSASQYGVNVEGPMTDQGNFIFSTRRSYLDLIFKANGLPFVPVYTDWNFSATYDITPTDKLFVLGIGAYDEVDRTLDSPSARVFNAGILDNSQNRWIGGVNYRHLTQNGYYDVTLSTNVTDFEFGQSDSAGVQYFDSDASEIENNLKFRYNRIFNNSLKMLTGVEITNAVNENRTRFEDFIYDRNGRRIQIENLGLPQELKTNSEAFKNAAFFELRLRPTQQFSIIPGIRANHFTFLDDSFYLAPRLNLRYSFNKVFSIKGSAGVYFQSPAYVWTVNPVNSRLKAMRNNMAIIGFDYLLREDTRLSLETYYKDYSDLPTGATPESNYLVQTNTGTGFGGREDNFRSFGYFPMVSEAYGNAYGFELLLQKKYSDTPLYGQMSVTYGKSEYTAGNGKTYPGQYDQRWIFNLYSGYKFNAKWEVSGKFRFYTGVPYTPVYKPDENPINPGLIQNIPEEYLSQRLEPGHQLDIRVDRYFNFDSWTLIAFIDIQNVYNNRLEIRPSYDFWEDEVTRRQDLGILPSIGISAEF